MRIQRLLFFGSFLFFLIFSAFPFAAKAEERVLNFAVIAEVQKDASMIVTEQITVNIEHKIIRRGITHAFPIKEIYDDRKLRNYGFELLSVKLDGKDVNYYEESAGYYHGLAVGNKDRLAPRGEHTYEIVYKTTGHVRDLPETDEIYYNVMGDIGAFPVDQASFTLHLPDAGEESLLNVVGYTGSRGESGSDSILEGKNTVKTTRTLLPGEGFTVAFAWKKGLVDLPSESFANMIGANRTLTLLAIFAIILLHFMAARYYFNRPLRGAVVPLFSPPEGMTPGYAAALKAMEYTSTVLHADIIWAAVNGFLRVDARKAENIILQKIDDESKKSGAEWAKEQCQELIDNLFRPGAALTGIDLGRSDGRVRAMLCFEHLEKKYTEQQKGFWQHNYIPVVTGVTLFVALFYWALQYIYSPHLDIGAQWGGVWEYLGITASFLGLAVLFLWGTRNVYRTMQGIRRIALVMVLPLLAIGTLAALLAVSSEDYFFLFMFTASLAATAWFIAKDQGHGRINPIGQEKFLQMRGLEMYIRTAEKDRLAKLNAPEDTVEKFEELLPYAIAFGCAEAWQKRFDKVLAELNYAPNWAENGGGRIPYRNLTGSAGMAAAASACVKLSSDYRASKGSGSSSGSSSSSGTSGGSSGGGSGGSSVGGW